MSAAETQKLPPDEALRMPRWQCHKIFRAARIIWMDPHSPVRWVDVEPDPAAERFRVRVPENFGARGLPIPAQSFLVLYDDGYLSWSPASAFEGGYTKIEE